MFYLYKVNFDKIKNEYRYEIYLNKNDAINALNKHLDKKRAAGSEVSLFCDNTFYVRDDAHSLCMSSVHLISMDIPAPLIKPGDNLNLYEVIFDEGLDYKKRYFLDIECARKIVQQHRNQFDFLKDLGANYSITHIVDEPNHSHLMIDGRFNLTCRINTIAVKTYMSV